MPDTTISRSGVRSEQLDEKFAATELEEVEKELARHDQDRRFANEKIEELARKLSATQAMMQLLLRERLGEIPKTELARQLRVPDRQV